MSVLSALTNQRSVLPERLPRLVRPELVDEVMHVDEEKVDLLDLLLALGRLGALDQNVYNVQKIHQH